jgi:hypothetical protein
MPIPKLFHTPTERLMQNQSEQKFVLMAVFKSYAAPSGGIALSTLSRAILTIHD